MKWLVYRTREGRAGEANFLRLGKARREEIDDCDLRAKYCGKIKDMRYVSPS